MKIFGGAIAALAVALFAGGAADVSAACWVVGGFTGQSIAKDDKQPGPDGFAGKQFRVVIDKNSAEVSEADKPCISIGSTTAVCIFDEGRQSVVDVWAIEPETGRVIHTATRVGYGALSGGRLFVGRVIRRCD